MSTEMPGATVDPQQLYRLATRLLSYPTPGGEAQKVRLLVGEIPPDLPLTLPLPPDAQVLGTQIIDQSNIQVVLDAPQPVDVILEFYRTQVTAAGWQAVTMPWQHGFGHAMMANQLVFCQGRRGPALTVQVSPRPQGTDVRLQFQLDPRHSPCTMRSALLQMPTSPIPALRMPSGASQRGGGGSGNDGNHWHSTTILETPLTAVQVADHYQQQLVAAQWQLLQQESSEKAAWSRWRLQDEEGDGWSGMLIVVNAATEKPTLFAFIHAELLP